MIESLFEYSPARPLVHAALDYRSLRQDMISSNLANVDTPMYRPRDIQFEEVLSQQAKIALEGKDPKELELAKTREWHLDKPEGEADRSTIFYRDGHMARNDGNSVDLDVEMSEMSKNGVMYTALINGLRAHGQIFRNMLDSSGKLS